MVFFKKTDLAPSSLTLESQKSNGQYNKEDVLILLHQDFKNKCYICESKGIESINIEHFAPHKDQNSIRKFNWSNLFWACSHCNQIKSDKEPLLNCIVNQDGVDTKIRYILDDDLLSGNKVIIEQLSNDLATSNTIELLQKVYQGTTPQNSFQAKEKRNKLYDEMSDFTGLVLKYFRSEDEEKKEDYQREISKQLSNRSAFTAFKRWFIKDNEKYKNEFDKYID